MDIKSTMSKCLDRFGKKHQIPVKNVRVRIEKQNGSLKYYVMNKLDDVDTTNIKEIIGSGLSMIPSVASQASDGLYDTVKKILNEYKIPEEMADIRVGKKGKEVKAYLYKNKKPFAPLNINELIN